MQQRPPHPLLTTRRAGVLMHITSLPGAHGSGDLGSNAHAFADWLARAGISVWQMLPIGPTGFGDSPYSSPSSFAIEPTFLALQPLVKQGLLRASDLVVAPRLRRAMSGNACDFPASRAFRMERYAKAAQVFARKGGFRSARYRQFVARNAWLTSWLDHGLDHGLNHELDHGASDDSAARAMHSWIQFELASQWAQLRAHCQSRGIALVGDVPIFVTADSADARANAPLFRLRKDGQPTVLTGVPPDDFSADGQLWGHPHYAWDAHIASKFAWWTARIACAAERFDLVRIDHFIGLTQAYEIPFGASDARIGRWRKAPGRALLTALAKKFPSLPLIAEDLGAVTPAVAALRDDFGLAGLRIVQNAFWSGKSSDLPHNHPTRCVAYSGTHDNETSVQWWSGRDATQRARFRAYAGRGPIHEVMNRIVLASPAMMAVLPMQDILGLGKSARMNLPGQSAGQWSWRMDAKAASHSLATAMHALIEATGRM